jgi:hypothetical protein|tara:strand:- start:802 stop:1278 length:477 start_codon:yes stop_codon:yes gene_type:complete
LRHQQVSTLIAQGVPNQAIQAAMRQEHGMSATQTDRLVSQVYQEWGDEDADRRPHLKQSAVRRMHNHINNARKAKAWGAVMQGERLLAQIQGTMEPTEVRVNVDAEVRESVMVLLSQLPQDRIDAMAQRALDLRRAAQLPAPTIVDAEAEPVEHLPPP